MAHPDHNQKQASGALTRTASVWALRLLVIVAAGAQATGIGTVDGLPTPAVPAWPWLIVLVVTAEFMVTHLRFRRITHSLTMTQIPIVIGLFFVTPGQLIITQVVGLTTVILVRRQVSIAATFRIAQQIFTTSLSIELFRQIVDVDDPLSARGWAAAVVGTGAAVFVGGLLDSATIWLAGGRLSPAEARDITVAFLIATTMNTGLALIGVHMLWSNAGSAWLALVPPFVLWGSYRAYVSQRSERQRLQDLYRATQELHESIQIEEALVAAAENARQMLDAELVEITIFPDGLMEPGYATMSGPGTRSGIRELVTLDDREQFWKAATASESATLMSRRRSFSLQVLDKGVHEFREAMVAPLPGEDPTVGMILVANGRRDTTRYSKRDLELLDTLAPLISVSLKNDQLEDSLAQVTLLKDELRHQASHDILTGLPNRALFAERVQAAITRCVGEDFLAVLYLDLDDFKTVNDSLGHEAGDELLKGVARRLIRASRPGDTVARLGGDEFGVLLCDIHSASDAEEAANRITMALVEPLQILGRVVSARASVGVAYARRGNSPSQVLGEADAAMYVAKRDEKTSFRTFETSMKEDLIQRLELKADLSGAAGDGQMRLHYQPIVDVATGATTGFEALVRWKHPRRGLVGPDRFIPFAEQHGLILEIGGWVLDEAVSRLAQWQRLPGHDDLSMAINISPVQLVEASFPEQLRILLEREGVSPGTIVLEVTENVIADSSLVVLEGLKRLGVYLAIDDFGTGYSSLSYIDKLPFDILKIDKAFVGKVGTASESALFRAMLKIGESMGLRTIVEGVETADQLERLRELGGDLAQGYHFARPMDEATVTAILGGHDIYLKSRPPTGDLLSEVQ